MFSHLLVPLDGSPIAAQAIPYAAALARAFGGSITLLAAIKPHNGIAVPASAVREESEKEFALTTAYLESVAAPLRARDVPVTILVRHGDATEAILWTTDHHDCSLIVMTTHGRSGIDRLRLGSVTQHIVHEAAIPALIIRGRDHAVGEGTETFSDVIVTLDGSMLAEQALPTACLIADALATPLTLLRILPDYAYITGVWGSEYYAGVWDSQYYVPNPEQEQQDEQNTVHYLEQIATRMRAPGRSVRVEWLHRMTNHVDPAITDYLAERPEGLVVMTSHERSGVMRWILGSTTAGVLAHAPCAMLMLHGDDPASAPDHDEIERAAPHTSGINVARGERVMSGTHKKR